MAAVETVTVDDLAAYLGIDDADDMCRTNLTAACQATNAWLVGALGSAADLTDPRAKMLGLAAASDMYDQRSFESDGGKVSSATRKLVADLSTQLRCEALARGGGS